MAQLSFLSIALNKKKLRCEKFLDEMLKVVPWQMLVSEISPYYTNNQNNFSNRGVLKQGGRPSFPLELMLKIHCLQQW
jgi:IS5 family transposase